MSFHSIDFALFLPVVFFLYWFVFRHNLKWQNAFIVFVSYVFYSWWDWRFLFLIILSTLIDYIIGLQIHRTHGARKRKVLLWISILTNLGILGFFKYYNFFIENLIHSFYFIGQEIPVQSLNIILPIGISFYTFQTLSYTIDIYRGHFKPTSDLIAFASYVAFFPQLVAGPIEKASNLLPQFLRKRQFVYAKAVDGLRQIIWGLFKKMVIADNCAEFANQIFSQTDDLNGSTLLLGALFFSIQIYGDFSGYSDIAIGTARLFGINLNQNFAFPYFSRNIAEFWRRWHISLTTWFRDYLYIPLGGSRVSTGKQIRNVVIVFLVSGLWHGANWTFLCWGAIHALLFIPLLLLKKNRKYLGVVASGQLFPTLREFLAMSFTFGLTVFAWIFFRAENMDHAFRYIQGIFSATLFEWPRFFGMTKASMAFLFIVFMLVVEWWGRHSDYALEKIDLLFNKSFRWGCYIALILIIYFFSNSSKDIEFIYFQF